MKIKFTVIGLGVCIATSEDNTIIYCVLSASHIFWNDKSFIGNSDDQNFVDFILEKCDEYRLDAIGKSIIKTYN